MTAYDLLHDWQTLIAGLVALGAAFIATRPVWHQLARMELQSNVMLREILVRQVPHEERLREVATKSISNIIHQMTLYLIDGNEFDTSRAANPHWAFERRQVLSSEADKFEVFRNSYRDAEQIELAKDGVASALKVLIETLDEIHTPASRDQYGEDYSISDEDWAAIVARSKVAPEELPAKMAAFDRAATALDKAYALEIESLRAKLRQLDDALFTNAA